MNSPLTREEKSAIRRGKTTFAMLSLALAVLIVISIATVLVIASEFDPDNLPEWLIFPFGIGIASITGGIVLSSHMRGRFRVREKARFVTASVNSLRSAGFLTSRAEHRIYKKLAEDLIRFPQREIERRLVAEGWPRARAVNYTGLMGALIARCEWNISSEEEAAEFMAFLSQTGWSDEDIARFIEPVIVEIKASGGRLMTGGMVASIGRNILWIVIILILASGALWLLAENEGLSVSKKYDYLKFIITAVLAIAGLGINIAAIIRKLGKKPGDSKRN
jgi:hypothetical protein